MQVGCDALVERAVSVDVEWGVSVEAVDSDQVVDHASQWIPIGHRLTSGLLGLNVAVFGTALVVGETFNPVGLQQPEVFVMVLMGLGLVWMLWYLLWSQKQPGSPAHTDHHAGSATVMAVLMLFAALSLLLCVFWMGYYLLLRQCQPLAKILSPFIQAPFFILQTYMLWAHSKDCIHKHKVLTRWTAVVLCGVWNRPVCQCNGDTLCVVFQKGYEILYPFNMEFTLLATCMLYVMWKNVGRHVSGVRTERVQKTLLRSVWRGGVLQGSLLGSLVLLSGVCVFMLYHVWIDQKAMRLSALLLFYCFHLVLLPTMTLCSLTCTLLQGQEGQGGGRNPTRSLDVTLLLGTAVGQLALSYLTIVAALALGPSGILGSLDLSYSLLSLVEMVMQNIFIIKALHLHTQPHVTPQVRPHADGYPHTHSSINAKEDQLENVQTEKEDNAAKEHELEDENDISVPPTGREEHITDHLKRRVIKEICAFLVLSNITLWVMSAFGARPELKTSVGKQFFGFSVWFVLVNLSQPLTVFYRMHAVGALMEHISE
ncbi:proton channel OTOP2-like isoform X3 [Brachyhypopomus gauderio]|uniref:proton channel OTOP2-like isoform X3 n=1 Tax=Brachyhypopomus gauderio TaxID=698409 RepID=UPI0040412894